MSSPRVLPARNRVFRVDDLTFRSDFDSGNLGNVQEARDADGSVVYQLFIAPDCAGTRYETVYRFWYYFHIEGGLPGRTIRCRIMDISQMCKVYNNDLRPLVRVPTLSPTWERLIQPCTTDFSDSSALRVTFTYTFGSREAVAFAFYYPFPYTDCQRLLRNIDHALGAGPAGTASGRKDRTSRLRGRLRVQGDPRADVYYHRELLVYSPEGRRVELLTVSSMEHQLSDREASLEGLFPEGGLRPHRFRHKPVVYVGARVHPGETAASYMLHGFLAFLLQPRNPYARELRNRFVFKIVPMLNPDGVFHGHFRTDVFGMNLNRMYAVPQLEKQPAIYAIKSVLRQAAQNADGGVWCFLDLHGFSARHGCYLIGNALPPHREARSVVFANALQLYAPQFNANACSFGRGRKSGPSKKSLYSTPYGPTPALEPAPSGRKGGAGGAGGEEEEDGVGGDGMSFQGEKEMYAAAIAQLHDPYEEADPPVLAMMEALGAPTARLTPNEQNRISKDWAQIKARSAGKGTEGQKDGTGRVCVSKEFDVCHSYTIECSCNLLSHSRAYSRMYAAAHLRRAEDAHPSHAHGIRASGGADADLSTDEEYAQEEAENSKESSASGHPAQPSPPSVPPGRLPRRKVVQCSRAEAPLHSQLEPRAIQEWLRDRTPGIEPPCLSRAPGYAPRHPYICQVDSLQPPPGAKDYRPPFGFSSRPGRGRTHRCPWGSCPFDPPSTFAAVGRSLAFALLESSGGTAPLFSRTRHSQWGSLDNLQRWARKCCSVAYGVPNELTLPREPDFPLAGPPSTPIASADAISMAESKRSSGRRGRREGRGRAAQPTLAAIVSDRETSARGLSRVSAPSRDAVSTPQRSTASDSDLATEGDEDGYEGGSGGGDRLGVAERAERRELSEIAPTEVLQGVPPPTWNSARNLPLALRASDRRSPASDEDEEADGGSSLSAFSGPAAARPRGQLLVGGVSRIRRTASWDRRSAASSAWRGSALQRSATFRVSGALSSASSASIASSLQSGGPAPPPSSPQAFTAAVAAQLQASFTSRSVPSSTEASGGGSIGSATAGLARLRVASGPGSRTRLGRAATESLRRTDPNGWSLGVGEGEDGEGEGEGEDEGGTPGGASETSGKKGRKGKRNRRRGRPRAPQKANS